MTRTVAKYISAGVLLTTLTHAQLIAQAGWGIGVIKGDIYLSDLDRGQVIKLDRNGKRRILVDDIHCHNLAPAFDGSVYWEAVGTNRGGMGDTVAIWRLSPNDELDYLMPPTPTPTLGVWISHDATGNSYSWHQAGERISQILPTLATLQQRLKELFTLPTVGASDVSHPTEWCQLLPVI